MMMALKIRSRLPNIINPLLCHNDTIYDVWSESTIPFNRKRGKHPVLVKIYNDLENKVWS